MNLIDGEPSWCYLSQVADMTAMLVNRETLIEDTSKLRDATGKTVPIFLSFAGNDIEFHIPWSMNVNLFDHVTGNVGPSSVPINIDGYLNAIDGSISMLADNGRSSIVADRLSIIGERLSSLSNLKVVLVAVPKTDGTLSPIISLKTVYPNHLVVDYTECIGDSFNGKLVAAHLELDLATGNSYLIGYTFPVKSGSWASQTFPRGYVNLGYYPNAQPTIDFILSGLLCPELDFLGFSYTPEALSNPDIFRIYTRILSTGTRLRITVSFDSTSTSSYPSINDVQYSMGMYSHSPQIALDDKAGVHMAFMNKDGVMQNIYFVDWLSANNIQYSSLSWSTAYEDFILFLQGQVTQNWDVNLLP